MNKIKTQREEIERKIKSIIEEVIIFDYKQVNTNEPLFGYEGIDELDIFEILMNIDKEFNLTLLDNKDIDVYFVTINDLCDIVESLEV